MKIGDKVKLIREDHWTKEDNLSLGQIYEQMGTSYQLLLILKSMFGRLCGKGVYFLNTSCGGAT